MSTSLSTQTDNGHIPDISPSDLSFAGSAYGTTGSVSWGHVTGAGLMAELHNTLGMLGQWGPWVAWAA